MSPPNHTPKQITLHVQAQDGVPYQVRFSIDEQSATGALALLSPAGDVAQHFELTRLQKGHHNSQLTCTIRGATTTLTLDDSTNPPELRVVATVWWPIFTATYCLSQAEQQRLVQWISTLAIDTRT